MTGAAPSVWMGGSKSERVRRIVLLNTGAFRNPGGQKLPFTLWLVRNTPIGAFLVRGLNAFSAGATQMAVINKMPAAVKKAYTAPYNNWRNRVATLRFVQDIPLNEGDDAYSAIRQIEDGLERLLDKEILICWGDQDFVFDETFLAEWERRFPDADAHRFPAAGRPSSKMQGTKWFLDRDVWRADPAQNIAHYLTVAAQNRPEAPAIHVPIGRPKNQHIDYRAHS